MKKTIISIISILSITLASAQNWPEATENTRPGTRWWWLGSAVDSANIAWNLKEYADHGIGSVEITPLYGVIGNEANELQFLSPEWMQALHQVEISAKENNVYVDMNQGTGWPFGGPETDIDHAACKIVFLIDTVETDGQPTKQLSEKEKKYAKIIAENRRSLDDGKEEVIRAYQSRTRQKVKRAAPGGEGWVMDHFDPIAVATYLGKFDKAFSETNTPYPRTFFNDSYEVYGANWTPNLFDEFEKRRGYKLQDKLAQLIGTIDDGNQVLCDYRETLAELLLEYFTEQWVDWCHSRGVKVRNQAHGSPANLIDLYAAVDIPETEGFGLTDFGIKGLRTDPGFTRKNDSDVSMLKYASSAAHITGKPLTSSETFTWLTEHFRTSLSQMKPDLDLMLTCGINNVMFHGTAYSPKDEPWPGWKFYASVDISPTNSIWRDAPAMMEYIERSQRFLQSGTPDNDFLVYLPVRDMWKKRVNPGEKGLLMPFEIDKMDKCSPEFIQTIMQIDTLGYDCDYISDKYLSLTDFIDGKITTSGGTKYKAVIIPDNATLKKSTKARLDSLAAKGATIIYGLNQDEMNKVAKKEALRSDLGLRAIRRADADGYHYFIANLTPEDVYQPVEMAVDFADALWFDPMTGEVYPAVTYNGYVEIDLRSGESRILRLYDHSVDKSGMKTHVRTSEMLEIDLSKNKWKLHFVESEPNIEKTYKLDGLKPWTSLDDKKLDLLMGTGVYTTTFNMEGDDLDRDWLIELGDVRESARVYLNGECIGTAWAAPFVLNCGSALRKGKNELIIEVTNLPANRIAAMDKDGVEWRRFKDLNIVDINYKHTKYDNWETMPSGLNSYVKLIRR